MYVAYAFGANIETDIFFFAVSFIALSSGLITTVMSSIFLPMVIQLRNKKNLDDESILFTNNFFSWLLVITFIAGLGTFLFTSDIFLFISKFQREEILININILRYFAFIFMATVLNEFYRVLLQSHGEFKVPAISNIIQPSVTILSIWILASRFNVESLAIVTLISRGFQLIYLQRASFKMGIILKINFSNKKNILNFLNLAYMYWIASFITMFSGFYFDYSATGLSGGSLTAISYAQKLYTLPISLLAIPILEILGTKFALLYASKEMGKIRDLYKQVVDMTLFVMVPVSAVLIGYGEDIVQILFGRGAFTKESVAMTASSLLIYSIAIPFIVLFQLNGRITMTLQKTKLASILGSVGHLFIVCATWWAVKEFNYIGIPLAKTGVELAYFLPFGMLCVYFYLGGINFHLLFKDACKTIFFAFIGVVIANKTSSFLLDSFQIGNFYQLIINLLLFFLIYYSFCRIGKVNAVKLVEKIGRSLFHKNNQILSS